MKSSNKYLGNSVSWEYLGISWEFKADSAFKYQSVKFSIIIRLKKNILATFMPFIIFLKMLDKLGIEGNCLPEKPRVEYNIKYRQTSFYCT